VNWASSARTAPNARPRRGRAALWARPKFPARHNGRQPILICQGPIWARHRTNTGAVYPTKHATRLAVSRHPRDLGMRHHDSSPVPVAGCFVRSASPAWCSRGERIGQSRGCCDPHSTARDRARLEGPYPWVHDRVGVFCATLLMLLRWWVCPTMYVLVPAAIAESEMYPAESLRTLACYMGHLISHVSIPTSHSAL
jgi:hypothetical protein